MRLTGLAFLGAAISAAGCSVPGGAVPADVSPAALAALPPGVPPAMLIQDSDGCYGLAIEATDPPQGVQLLYENNLPICDA